MAKLTDRQRKNVIAAYVNGDSLRQIAKRYGVAASTIKRIVDSNPQAQQKATHKKEQNTQDVLRHMDRQADAFKNFMDYTFNERLNPAVNREELDKVPLPQLMTAFGIYADKMIKVQEVLHRKENDVYKMEIAALRLERANNEGGNEPPPGDGFLDALNASAATAWNNESVDDSLEEWTGEDDVGETEKDT